MMNSRNLLRIGWLWSVALLSAACSGPSLREALEAGDLDAANRALKKNADPNEFDAAGLRPLQISISKDDPLMVDLLIQHGADVTAESAGGEAVFVTALSRVVMADLKAAGQLRPDAPPVRVMRAIMRARRMTSGRELVLDGELQATLQWGGLGPGGFQLTPSVALVTDSSSYRLFFSRWETEYIDVERTADPDEWNILLRPGRRYRITGIPQSGSIEASRLQLIGSAAGASEFVLPLRNYLPTTWEVIKANSWLGKSQR